MRITVVFFIFTIYQINSFSQAPLNKNEIYSTWCYINENREILKSNFDLSVVHLIDSLKSQKIDTIGIFETTTYDQGFILTNEQNIKPEYTGHIHWIHNGITYYQKTSKEFSSNCIKIQKSQIIEFYIDNKNSIDKERIMPVIHNIIINDDGTFTIENSWSSSSISFAIYCEISGSIKFTKFESYSLENKDNIFYYNNINSKINNMEVLHRETITRVK